MGDEIVVAWPQGKKVTLISEIGSSQMQVRIRRQRDWFGLNGELQIDKSQSVEMDKLLRLLQQAPGRFLHLDDGRILTLSRQLRHQLDTLNAIRDQGKVHPLATVVVEEATEGMVLKGGKPWREQVARLHEAESLQPQVPATLQAELRDYQINGNLVFTGQRPVSIPVGISVTVAHCFEAQHDVIFKIKHQNSAFNWFSNEWFCITY